MGKDTTKRTAGMLEARPFYLLIARGVRQILPGPKALKCAVCGSSENLRYCSRCKTVRYVRACLPSLSS